jgi:hypothetical protein
MSDPVSRTTSGVYPPMRKETRLLGLAATNFFSRAILTFSALQEG